MRYRSPRHLRLRSRQDIVGMFRDGSRAGDEYLLVIARSNPEKAKIPRGGVAMSRKHGGAVQRNRIKRQCREAIRLCRVDLPAGCDYLLMPRVAVTFTVEQLCESLRRLAKRAAKKASRSVAHDG